MIGNEAEVVPARTVTCDWTVAFTLLEDRLMPTPPVAAGPDRVTVPVRLSPPSTVEVESVKLARVGAVILSAAVCVELPRLAVSATVLELCTAIVFTINVPVVEPPATVTVEGTVALVLPDDKLTTVPVDGAGPLNVTVPVEAEPPVTEAGDTASPTNVGGLIVKLPVWLTPFKLPVMDATVAVGTPAVVIVKVAVVAPAATVTDGTGVA